MDKQQQLLQVKQKILEGLLPLAIEGEGPAEERAETILSIIELGNTTPELYVKALEAVNSLEDKSLKSDFLMRLLGNVQLALGAIDDEASNNRQVGDDAALNPAQATQTAEPTQPNANPAQ